MANNCSNMITLSLPEDTKEGRERVVNATNCIYKKFYGTHELDIDDLNFWEDDSYQITFDTKWVPCFTELRRIAQKYTDVNFLLEYEELGTGFCGIAEYTNGLLSKDMCYLIGEKIYPVDGLLENTLLDFDPSIYHMLVKTDNIFKLFKESDSESECYVKALERCPLNSEFLMFYPDEGIWKKGSIKPYLEA